MTNQTDDPREYELYQERDPRFSNWYRREMEVAGKVIRVGKLHVKTFPERAPRYFLFARMDCGPQYRRGAGIWKEKMRNYATIYFFGRHAKNFDAWYQLARRKLRGAPWACVYGRWESKYEPLDPEKPKGRQRDTGKLILKASGWVTSPGIVQARMFAESNEEEAQHLESDFKEIDL